MGEYIHQNIVNDIGRLIRTRRPNLSENSLFTYINNVKRLIKLISIETPLDTYDKFIESIYNYNLIELIINSHINSNHSKHLMLNVVKILLICHNLEFHMQNTILFKNTLNKYIHFDLNIVQKIQCEQQNRTPKEIENWPTEEFMAAVKERQLLIAKKIKAQHIYNKQRLSKNISDIEEFPKKSHLNDFQRYIIWSLYTKRKPIRNDYSDIIIKDIENNLELNRNYLILSTSTLILNTYKTAKTYGQKRFIFEEELMADIKFWLELSNQSKYLLINLKNYNKDLILPLQKNSIRLSLNRIFSPKVISTQILRSYFVSISDKKRSYEEMEADALDMLHSVKMAETYYRKIYPRHNYTSI